MQNRTDSTDDARQLLEIERAARAEAERASRLKDEFLVQVSHELRTPLSAVLGWSQLLRDEGIPVNLSEGLEAIEYNARAQIRIIDDLLDAGRLMVGKISLESRPVRLPSLLRGTVCCLRPTAFARQVSLESYFETGVPPVLADPHRLDQVFRNLISNAIKFTPPRGRVRVVLREHEGAVQVSVADTGSGIEAKTLTRLFDRYWQGDRTGVRPEGLGIGLWIAKQIVDLHGGTISTQSDGPGTGSTFTVTLPPCPRRLHKKRRLQ